MRFTLVLLLVISCGKNDGEVHQCLTMEEARIKCQAEEISKGVPLEEAERYCKQIYDKEGCYE